MIGLETDGEFISALSDSRTGLKTRSGEKHMTHWNRGHQCGLQHRHVSFTPFLYFRGLNRREEDL